MYYRVTNQRLLQTTALKDATTGKYDSTWVSINVLIILSQTTALKDATTGTGVELDGVPR